MEKKTRDELGKSEIVVVGDEFKVMDSMFGNVSASIILVFTCFLEIYVIYMLCQC